MATEKDLWQAARIHHLNRDDVVDVYESCWKRTHEESHYEEMLSDIIEFFFPTVQRGLKAGTVIWCGSDSLPLGRAMSARYANECIPQFFEKHIRRALKEGLKETLCFEIIEGESDERFVILQEKKN